jgi:hypothetical protein
MPFAAAASLQLKPHARGRRPVKARPGTSESQGALEISSLDQFAVPRKMAMEISGHKTESVYRRYDIVSPQDMKLAAAKMENYLEGLKSRATTTVEEKQN